MIGGWWLALVLVVVLAAGAMGGFAGGFASGVTRGFRGGEGLRQTLLKENGDLRLIVETQQRLAGDNGKRYTLREAAAEVGIGIDKLDTDDEKEAGP